MTIRNMALAAGLALPLACPTGAFAQSPTYVLTEPGHETVVTGFVGSSFGSAADNESVDFGGSFSWLYESAIGAEVLAGFAPNFSLTAAELSDTTVANYMLNAIAALPLGRDNRLQPFVSGGVGALTLRTGSEIESALGLGDVHETELGGNVGAGLMAFADRWGVRADVRYFSQLGEPDAGTTFLDGFDFWRTNVGVAYRW